MLIYGFYMDFITNTITMNATIKIHHTSVILSAENSTKKIIIYICKS